MRTAEVGQLVVSGTGRGQPLFKVAEVDVVRVFVNVPQLYASGIQVGHGRAHDDPRGARARFPGKVATHLERARHGHPHAPRRGRHPEPRPRARLRDVRAGLVRREAARPPLFVPATSALFDASGTRVALVRDGAVHWQNVEIEADLGDKLAIASGLARRRHPRPHPERAPDRGAARGSRERSMNRVP